MFWILLERQEGKKSCSGPVRCGFRTGGWNTSGRLSPKMTRKWRRPNQNRNLDGQAGGHPSVIRIRKKWKSTRKRQVTLVPTREYWMIDGGPGFLIVEWCGSSPTPFAATRHICIFYQTGDISWVEMRVDGELNFFLLKLSKIPFLTKFKASPKPRVGALGG